MQTKTEFSERPPAYTVLREGAEAVVRFYTDVHETERDGETIWEAVEWAGKYPWADNLESRIAADPGIWLDHIRLTTEKEEQARKYRELDAAIVSGLPDLVLDLDFRLTLAKEFGF